MNRTYDKFQVVLLSEVKGKDSNAFIFELRLTSEDNCRIRIIDFDAFDIDGNKYSAGADKISTTDVILGHSKFFAETKKINVKISSQFKARIGCMAVLTVACIEDKQQMKFCFQRKGTNRWDCVGVEFMEYEGLPAAEEEPVETEGTLEPVEELTDKAEKQVQAQTEALTQTGASAVKEDGEEQAAVVVQDSPAEDIPAAQDEKAAAESLEEYLEREGAESVLGMSMKEFVNRFALGTQTVEDVLKQLNVNVAQEEEPAETISQPAPVSQPEEEEQEQSIEDYLNSLIEFDEKSSETIGLAVSNMRIRAEEHGDTVCPVLYCEVSYSKETYVLVRCPMIKVIFYDAKGCIDNVAMHPVSRIHTGQDIVEMAFKKSTVKNWKNKSKIKVLVTL